MITVEITASQRNLLTRGLTLLRQDAENKREPKTPVWEGYIQKIKDLEDYILGIPQ